MKHSRKTLKPMLGPWAITLACSLGFSAGVQAAEPDRKEPARFDVLEYRVEGNSLLSSGDIERAVMPHMGERQTLVNVEAARAALERQYHEAGYLTVLVSIPEQNVDSGVVDLLVTEAPVGKLRVVGSQFHAPSDIKSGLGEVAEGKVPNFLALQKQLAGVNKTADLRVAPVLKPGKTPGTVEVQLDVDDQLPLHGSIELSNRQSPNTTATRLGASVRFDNLWQRHHSFGMTLQTSPQSWRETRLAVFNYMLPISSDGDALTIYSVTSRSEFATIYNSPGLGVLGNTDILGLRYALRLDSTANYSQSLTAGIDYKHILQSVVLDGQADADPALRYAPVSLTYRGSWLNDGVPTATLDLSTIVGMRGWLGNSDTVFNTKRTGASASFMAFRSGLQVDRQWGRWGLSGKVEAQMASGPLLPSEQFVGGGADSVRGYLEGERSGDRAVRASLELSSPTVKLGPQAGQWRVSGIAFVDAAVLMVAQARANQDSSFRLGGLGAGLRLNGPQGVGLQLDAAMALSDGDVAGGGTAKGDWRIHARGVMEF